MSDVDPTTQPRRLLVCRGAPEQTEAEARRLVGALDEVLWVDGDTDVGAQLGSSFQAVVLDLHGGLDPDALGRAHGLIWGGGGLVLRMPPEGVVPDEPRLIVKPYTAADVTPRLWRRFERLLARAEVTAAPLDAFSPGARGTDAQAALVERIGARFSGEEATVDVVIADRGRGKSSALGLALARTRGLRLAVTADSRRAAAEVLRFAPPDTAFVPLADALDVDVDVLVVDEAARLPVPALQHLVRAHPAARLAFATTVHGYEGTGRGFVLRFLEWLEHLDRPLTRHTLSAPIRWGPGDPLERFVFGALLLDARPVPDDVAPSAPPVFDRDDAEPSAAVTQLPEAVDRDALVDDEARLRALFGLLVHAHYRTTPSDLHRVLDAPNLRLHAVGDAAVTLVALEGGLDAATCDDVYRGRYRIRGHALPDTLVSHCGRPDAGGLRMARSVRIATHPDQRREGVATALVEHVHRHYDVDLFGTLFGATPELLRFRRSLGYHLIRVGAARGSRTGEPAAVMVHPFSDAARRLVDDLQAALARELPLQLTLLGGELPLDPELPDALRADLPPPAPLTRAVIEEAVRAYAFGPRPFEAAPVAIGAWINDRDLGSLDDGARALVEGRLLAHRTWREVADAAGAPSVPAAMRALRRAVRSLAAALDPG